MDTKANKSFVCDDPINFPKEDRFQRNSFAERIAYTIAARKDPSSIIIGIHAPWGAGKTSVLNLIAFKLKDYKNIVSVKFNPWRFDNEDLLISDFFRTLADAIGQKLTSKKEMVGQWLEDYANVILPITLTIADIVKVEPAKAAKALGKKLSSIDLDILKNRVEDLLISEEIKVVIYMDDLDRLSNKEIQSVFKLIKLSADFKHTIYLSAFDDNQVSNALSTVYGKGDEKTGRAYLEKIIQVPLHLPSADRLQLRQLCFENVDEALKIADIELSEEDVQNYVRNFTRSIEPLLKTPRLAKRYGNALTFSLPLLKGEVNIVDLMLIEALRIFVPKIYEFIRENEVLLTGTFEGSTRSEDDDKKTLLDSVTGCLAEVDQHTKEQLIKLLSFLFPKLETIYENVYRSSDHEDKMAKNKKVCSSYYFSRFFSYVVSDRDIPDETIRNIIEEIKVKEPSEIQLNIESMMNAKNADKFVYKLRLYEEKLEPTNALKLSLAIAPIGSLIPNPQSFMFFSTPFSQAGILISKLVELIPKGIERKNAAISVLESANPLTFACEIFRWMRSNEDDPEDKRYFSNVDEIDILGKINEKISKESISTNFFSQYPNQITGIFSLWLKGADFNTTKTYIENKLDEEPNLVVDLLKAYTPKAYGGDSPDNLLALPSKTNVLFCRENTAKSAPFDV